MSGAPEKDTDIKLAQLGSKWTPGTPSRPSDGEYVLVRKSSIISTEVPKGKGIDDVKSISTSGGSNASSLTLTQETLQGLQNGLRNSSKSSNKGTLKTVIVEEVQKISSSNTALSSVSTLTPLNLSECKTFALVYDIARCTAIEVEGFFMTTNASGVPTGAAVVCHGAFAYDPANAAAYASVANVLSAKRHVGPMPMSTNLIGGPVLTGHNSTKCVVKVPPVVDPGLVTDLLGSNWVGATDTSVIVGYLKPYVEAAGASTQTVITYFIKYFMEFAFRT
jgi:hypothetical protein